MIRDARIYLKKSDFIKVLIEMESALDVDLFFKKAYKYRNKELFLKVASTRRKKVSRAIETNGDAELFNSILTDFRLTKDHIFVKLKSQSKDWSTLMQVCQVATEFCDAHNISYKEGYGIFISIGYDLMNKKYRLNKYLYLESKITEKYQTDIKIESSEYRKTAVKLFNHYCKLLKNLTKQAKAAIREKYLLDFILTAEVLMEHKFDGPNYLKTQIDHFKKLGIEIMPYNLHTEEAILRFKISGKKSTDKDSKFDKLKKKNESK